MSEETVLPAYEYLPLRHTRDGWYILGVPWEVVPGFDFEAACIGMGQAEIEMELKRNWSVTRGKPVYPEFSVDKHVARQSLVFDPSRPLHCGYDWLGTPAFVPTQLNAFGQWLIFPSLSPPESESIGIYEFAEQVANHLLRRYAAPHGLSLDDLELVHVGDPSGRNPPARTAGTRQETASAFEILKRGSKMYLGEDDRGEPVFEEKPGWGWRVIPGAMRISDRIEAVRARLTTTLKGGLSALVVDPAAQVVKDGLQGGYHYKRYSDDTYSRDPEKTHESHTCDALAYIATRLFARNPRAEEDEDDPKRPPVISQAANRSYR
jgi:hypothetical protein